MNTIFAPNAAATPLIASVEALLLDLVGDLVEVRDGEVTPQSELNDLGFDSVAYHGLAGLINDEYGLDLSPTIFFDVHTPHTIAARLVAEYASVLRARHSEAAAEITAIESDADREPIAVSEGALHEPIAIIGMAGSMPRSSDLGTFWRHLVDAHDLIDDIPSERWDWRAVSDLTPIHWGGFMPDMDRFDAGFFSISPTEAEQMDPQQRLFLETAWKAFEDAGIRPSALAGSDTGVFVGVGTADYRELSDRLDGHTATGVSHCILANRLSFLLDLHGPSEPVDTACSSSLVAVHRAIEALRRGECGLAVVGGVNAMLTPGLFVALTRAGMLSPTGRCRTFSRHADGYVRGEGVAALVLKPLSRALADGNPVHAVIRASAINHGGRATSLTAPNASAQASLIETAWRRSGLDPSSVGYIEAHGTGTALGDPVEVEALKRAFATLYRDWNLSPPDTPHCGLGSVKTNIGHLEAAAGIAGLTKVVLAMRHGVLPASLHGDDLNPYISLDGTPFYVTGRTTQWRHPTDADGRSLPYRAGVSSFGFGGVNAHVVVESFERSASPVASPGEDVFVLSARDEERLNAYARSLLTWLADHHPALADLCRTSRIGREAMACRLAVAARDLGELRQGLSDYVNGASPRGPETAAYHEPVARWLAGETVDWSLFPIGHLISMPSYPFARIRHWCATKRETLAGARGGEALAVMGETTEEKVAAICAGILGHAGIDPGRRLAEAGADSILMANIRGRIAQVFGVELSLGAMIEAGTPAAIAAMIEGRLAGTETPLVPRPAGDNPVSAAQAQFFFLDRMAPGNPAFNLPGALRVEGPFDVDAAVETFTRLVRENGALHARFHQKDGCPVLMPDAGGAAPAQVVDLAPLLPRDQDARVREFLEECARSPFDIETGPLCRLLILELGDEDHVVLLCVHHIAADFTSVALLLRGIVSAGQGQGHAQTQPSPPKLDYPDYAWWESRYLGGIIERELPYWQDRLTGLAPAIVLPFDHARPVRPTWRGATIRFELDRETVASLAAFARREEVSSFIVLLAAFDVLLHQLSDSRDIVVGSPYANRSMPGTGEMIGSLAYSLILRTWIDPSDDFSALVGRVRRDVHDAFDHLYVPYPRLVEVLNPERRPGVNPLFQVMFNLIQTGEIPPEWQVVDVDSGWTDYDLSLRVHMGARQAVGYLQFGLDVFTEETARLIAEHYRDLVRALLAAPETKLNTQVLPPLLADRRSRALERAAPIDLRVASTFTDRPLAEGLDFWSDRLGRPVTVEFAGYNQLFQELLDPNSPLAVRRRGCNVVMARCHDWLRFEEGTDPDERCSIVEETLDDLAEALASASTAGMVPTLVLMLPADPARSGLSAADEARLLRFFADRLSACPGLSVRHGPDLPTMTPMFDPIGDDTGHVPFTRAYYAALATLVVQWMESLGGDPVTEGGRWNVVPDEIVAAVDLKRSDDGGVRQPYAAPRNDLERCIVAAFEATLSMVDIGLDDGFFDLGGHSLRAIGLLYRINEAVGAKLTVADVFMAPTPRRLAECIASGRSDQVYVDLSEAAVLDRSVRRLEGEPAAVPSDILLTGATGFVGRFLLRELLDRTSARIHCLVRAGDDGAAMTRLRGALQGWGLWQDGDGARLTAIPGDLAAPRLGLADDVHDRLCRGIDAIIHNGTSMNHLETFATARIANVEGVRELLRMTTSGRPKRLDYVSTLGVFSSIGRDGETVFDESSSIDDEKHAFAAGYTTSKWVGESLVHQARERGVPCSIFRLGLVTGDSLMGRYDHLQSFHRLLESCIRLGAAFQGFRYDLVITPVDYVARAVVHLGCDCRGGGVFHLSSMDVTPMEEVFRLYNHVAEPPLAILTHRQWLDLVKQRFLAGDVLPIVPVVQQMMDMDDAALERLTAARARTSLIYDCTQTQTRLKAAGISVPRFDADLLRVYLRGMMADQPDLPMRLRASQPQPA